MAGQVQPVMNLINKQGPYPPGGYPFVDPRTGMKFNGMEAGFYEQVSKIQRHRLANPNLYPRNEVGYLGYNNIATELDQYQCARLGNHPQFCSDSAAAPTTRPGRELRTQPSDVNCPRCGNRMVGVGCQTCVSFKLQHYHCNACGFDKPR